jgi:hypothetical protein
MFIRRGFYKLHFAVEIDDRAHEVSIVDANNDGNNGDTNGDGKNGDAHDMDTDKTRKEVEEAPKQDDHVGSSSHNGMDGMQEQCVQVGSLDVKLASPGNFCIAKSLDRFELEYTSISDVIVPALNDKTDTDYKADLLLREASPGLGAIGIGVVG